MGKKENRQLIGLRMRASEIKRRRYDSIKSTAGSMACRPICGKLIHKPKRGPTASVLQQLMPSDVRSEETRSD